MLVAFAVGVIGILLYAGVEWLHHSLEKQGCFYDAEYDMWFQKEGGGE